MNNTLLKRLRAGHTDWNGDEMPDDAPPMDCLRAGDARDAAAEIVRLRADRDCEKRLRKDSDDLATDLRIALVRIALDAATAQAQAGSAAPQTLIAQLGETICNVATCERSMCMQTNKCQAAEWASLSTRAKAKLVAAMGWGCKNCGIDRTKAACPIGYSAALTGQCPMSATAQQVPQPIAPAQEPSLTSTRVRKTGGSFQHTGVVVAEFSTSRGQPRIVLEFDPPVAGMLHVYRPDQVEPA